MKSLFITFLLFAFYGSSWRAAQGQTLQVPAVQVYPVAPVNPSFGYVYPAVPVTAPPPMIYRPQIYYQPYQYQGSVYRPKTYRTPIRNWLFGTGTVDHYYSPQKQQ